MVVHQSINTLTDVLSPSIPAADQVIVQWLFDGLYLGVAAVLVAVFGPARLSHASASDGVFTASVRRQARAGYGPVRST